MTFLRLLWPILMDILIAAHFLRFSGFVPAVLILLFGLTLLIRHPFMITLWQVLLGLGILFWIYVSLGFIQFRLAVGAPWMRLAIIMTGVILVNAGCIWWMNRPAMRKYFRKEG